MIKFDDLVSHAAPCDGLAQACSDPVIAEKLRRLARDHRDSAREQLDRPFSFGVMEERLLAALL
jgi:hypothetical protein